MSAKTDANIQAGVADFLHPAEQVSTYLFASVRGHQQAMAGGVAGMVGGGRAGKAVQEAAAADLTLASPMALVLTPTRLLMVEVGNAGRVKRLLNELDLGEVGAMTVKRLGLGASVTIEIRGTAVRLESRVGASREFAEALAAARAARG